MAHHNRITSYQTSKPNLTSSQDMSWAPTSTTRREEPTTWNTTHSSAHSARSTKPPSSNYYPNPLPITGYSYTSTPASTADFDSYSSYPYRDLMDHAPRITPTSLGWLPDTKLWKLYKFVVTKGKEPYLELLPDYVRTRETPERVYLDLPVTPWKNTFPCQFPGGCSGKRVFSRPADLDRHYKNVHASVDQKDCFPCDYGPCARSKEPFTRKDHYRDHLKDFHKEDLGSAKAGKVEKGSARWLQMQDQWLKERRISPRHWRCARCLARVKVEEHGWVCGKCGVECERHRVEAREELKRNENKSGKKHGPSSRGPSVGSSSQQAPRMQWTYPETCGACHGTGWVNDNGHGGWMACLSCQPIASSSMTLGVADWGSTSYASGSNNYYN